MSRLFEGVIPAIVTPMHDDESINTVELRNQVNRQINAGAKAIFCLGTNGEFFALSYKEKMEVINTVVDEVRGRVKILVGSGCVTTKETIVLSREAKNAGADGISVITPYFAGCSQNDLFNHYTAVADQCDIPLMIYNNPARAGINISYETVKRLTPHPNIIGIKDSSGNFDNTLRYIEVANQDFIVLCGNDSLILWNLMAGGQGGISGISNIFPERMLSIYTTFKANNFAKALEIQNSVRAIRDTLKLGNSNSIVKQATLLMGYPVGPARAPFNINDQEIDNKIIAALKQYSEYAPNRSK
jgi:4-hydroxy-tetrahydrodipicolinate synthase